MQNDKLENPQTLSEHSSRSTISRKITFSSIRFFFTRAVTESVWGLTGWVSRDKDSELLKNRLKIKEETNSASENLNSKSAN